MTAERLGTRALNRALLARQGLLERLPPPVEAAAEAIGAVQAQHWPAVAVALWSRVDGLTAEDVGRAFEDRRLVVGTLLRRTIHAVSAREHPAYAVVFEGSDAAEWRRAGRGRVAGIDELRADLARYAAEPRGPAELEAFVEGWIERHGLEIDEAELAHQRSVRWRPLVRSLALARAPENGRWLDAKGPSAFLAPPSGERPAPDEALDAVVLRHLRAFGPAAADDVAGWIGWRTPPVRAALERLAPRLVRFEDEAGRALLDLPDAPRPDPEVPAPVRLLPWFDSTLLAYTPKHRARLLPDAHRDRVYVRANLQWLPTFLVDGMVAGTWSVADARREATLSLRPLEPVAAGPRAALVEEAERLLRLLRPEARAHHVAVEAGD